MRTSSLAGTSGMSWPRYCTSGRPLEISIVRASISSSRVTSDSGTAFGCGEPARNTSSDSVVGLLGRALGLALVLGGLLRAAALPIVWATPFGSMIMITEPSPRMVLPQNIGMCRSLLDIGFTTISSVWKTPSTTMPKVWLPTWVTTMKPFSTSASPSLELEQRLEVDQRQELVAQPQHGRVLDALDAMLGIAAHAHQLDHGELRDGEAVAAGLHDQRRDDGERQRNLDGEAGAPAEHRLDVDGAADLVDIGAHDVHADAAAGHARHLARRWRSRARR